MDQLDERVNLALGFLRMAYNDYIAARVLLNRNYTMQGVMLASTSIERYFKTVICIYTGEKLRGHLDKFEDFKRAVEEMGYGLLIEKMDPLFIDLLAKAYKLRYYDTIKEPTSIGFFKNQFLGELDGLVELFERLVIITRGDREPILSPYKKAYKENNPDLMENNWIAMKIDKKKFMETDCIGFAIYVHPNNVFEEINVSSEKMALPYDGSMTLINVKGDAKDDTGNNEKES